MSEDLMAKLEESLTPVAKTDVTYTVQIERQVSRWYDEASDVEPAKVWQDIATISVAPRTKRSTVIKKALAAAGIEPGGEKLRTRALDVDSAEVHEPEPYQPPSEWRLA